MDDETRAPKPTAIKDEVAGRDREERIVETLLNHAHVSADLIWKRANILILLNGAALALVGKLLTDTDEWNWTGLAILFVVSVAGVTLGVVWRRMHDMSEYYNTIWMHDARYACLASKGEYLKLRYYFSLGFWDKEKEEDDVCAAGHSKVELLDGKGFEISNRPTRKGATEHFRSVILGDIALWSITLVYALVSTLMLLGRTLYGLIGPYIGA